MGVRRGLISEGGSSGFYRGPLEECLLAVSSRKATPSVFDVVLRCKNYISYAGGCGCCCNARDSCVDHSLEGFNRCCGCMEAKDGLKDDSFTESDSLAITNHTLDTSMEERRYLAF